jgi:hypothetical protein
VAITAAFGLTTGAIWRYVRGDVQLWNAEATRAGRGAEQELCHVLSCRVRVKSMHNSCRFVFLLPFKLCLNCPKGKGRLRTGMSKHTLFLSAHRRLTAGRYCIQFGFLISLPLDSVAFRGLAHSPLGLSPSPSHISHPPMQLLDRRYVWAGAVQRRSWAKHIDTPSPSLGGASCSSCDEILASAAAGDRA